MDSAVRTRLEKHIISAQARIFRGIVGGSFELLPNWGRGYSGLSSPTFNVFLPRKPEGLTDETLADSAAFFSSRDTLYAIELVHDKIPHGPDFLAERRYLALPPEPAMARSISAGQSLPQTDITVIPVTTVSGLSAFWCLQNEVFDFSLHDLRKRFPVSQLKAVRIRHYLAFLDERPVGAGSVVCLDGVASIWNLGTLDAFRGRGVASGIVHRALFDAVNDDCDLATLYSSAQAYKFFSKMGFEIFTQRQWFLPQNIEYEVDE